MRLNWYSKSLACDDLKIKKNKTKQNMFGDPQLGNKWSKLAEIFEYILLVIFITRYIEKRRT